MSQDIVDTDQAVARWAWVTTWWPGLCSRAAAGVLCLLVAGCGTVAPSSSPSASAGSRELAATDPLYFNAVSEPGHRGGQAAVTIQTVPGVRCAAVFLWPGMPSGGQVLIPVTSGADGVATLGWAVEPGTPPGSWRIDATCGGREISTHVPID